MIATQILAPRDPGEAAAAIASSEHNHFWLSGAATSGSSLPGPAPGAVVISTGQINAVTEYEPADLTITVQAGCQLAHMQETLAGAGQFLPCDYSLAGTVGGLISSGTVGPRALGYGAVRDRVLGLTVITSDGSLARSGSRVVKSVAGFDLPKLYCGSFGTLGLIVEATLKVSPLPAQSETLTFTGKRADLGLFAGRLLGSYLRPASMVATAEAPAPSSDSPRPENGTGRLVVRIEGSRARVRRQLEEIRSQGADAGLVESDDRPDAWPEAEGDNLIIDLEPASARDMFTSLPFAGRLIADLGVGRVRADPAGRLSNEDIVNVSEWLRPGGTLTARSKNGRLVRRSLQPAATDLMRRLKQALDPNDRFNRGLLDKLL